jgi:1-acyl-sn-glycerol-3-phosphate acyltransferase
MLALDLELSFLGKHTLFEGPLAPLMRGLGGIPVDRSHPGSGVVAEMAARFAAADRLLLARAPEGTRRAVGPWRSGFHTIAVAAEVPIAAVALDWGARRIRFGPVLRPSADVERDMGVFREFFDGARGRRPPAAA